MSSNPDQPPFARKNDNVPSIDEEKAGDTAVEAMNGGGDQSTEHRNSTKKHPSGEGQGAKDELKVVDGLAVYTRRSEDGSNS